jgi:hypothetical protein
MRILLPFNDTHAGPGDIVREVARSHSKSSEVHALFVVDSGLVNQAAIYSESLPPSEIEKMLIGSTEENGWKYLGEIKKEFEKRGFSVNTKVRVGDLVEETVKEARESKIDMVALTSTENIDISKLSQDAPLLITVLKFRKNSLPVREAVLTAGLGIATLAWYYFVFADLELVNKYLLAGKSYSGILVGVILVITVSLYGTFVGNILRFIGLDTKSAH